MDDLVDGWTSFVFLIYFGGYGYNDFWTKDNSPIFSAAQKTYLHLKSWLSIQFRNK